MVYIVIYTYIYIIISDPFIEKKTFTNNITYYLLLTKIMTQFVYKMIKRQG